MCVLIHHSLFWRSGWCVKESPPPKTKQTTIVTVCRANNLPQNTTINNVWRRHKSITQHAYHHDNTWTISTEVCGVIRMKSPAEVGREDVQTLSFLQKRMKGASVWAVDHVTLIGFPERQHPKTHVMITYDVMVYALQYWSVWMRFYFCPFQV